MNLNWFEKAYLRWVIDHRIRLHLASADDIEYWINIGLLEDFYHWGKELDGGLR